MARKKRLVIEGATLEAVELLAESAGLTPGELIVRALRREDEAQQEKASPASSSTPPAAGESSQVIYSDLFTHHLVGPLMAAPEADRAQETAQSRENQPGGPLHDPVGLYEGHPELEVSDELPYSLRVSMRVESQNSVEFIDLAARIHEPYVIRDDVTISDLEEALNALDGVFISNLQVIHFTRAEGFQATFISAIKIDAVIQIFDASLNGYFRKNAASRDEDTTS